MAMALRHAAPAFCRGYINMLFRYFLSINKRGDEDENDIDLYNIRMGKNVSYYSIDFDSNTKEMTFAKLFYEKACKGADLQTEMKRGGAGKIGKNKLSAANLGAEENPLNIGNNSREPKSMKNKKDFIAYICCCVEILNHGSLRKGKYAAINQFEDDSLRNSRATIFKQWMLWSPNNSHQFSKCYWPESLGLYYIGCAIITARESNFQGQSFGTMVSQTMGRIDWDLPTPENAEIRTWLKLRPINVFLNDTEVTFKKEGDDISIYIEKPNYGASVPPRWQLTRLSFAGITNPTETNGGYIEVLGELLPTLLTSTGVRDKGIRALYEMSTEWTRFEFGDSKAGYDEYIRKCWIKSGRSEIIANAITNVRRIIRRKAIHAAALYMDRHKTNKNLSGDQTYYKTSQSGDNRPFQGKALGVNGFDADTLLDGIKTNSEKRRIIEKTTKGGTPGREKMTLPRKQPQRLGDYDEYEDKEQDSERMPYQYYRFVKINVTQDKMDDEGQEKYLWETLERIRHLVSGGDGLPAWHDKMFQKNVPNYKDDTEIPDGYRRGFDAWTGRSSRTGVFPTEAAHTAIPIKQVVNMVMSDLLTASGPIYYNDKDPSYVVCTPDGISKPETVEPNHTIVVDRLCPPEADEKWEEIEYPLNDFKLSRNDSDGGTEGELVWTWEHLRTVEDGLLWKKIMLGLFTEGVYQWNSSPDVFMGLASAHWWVDDADAALETAKNLGWQRDIVENGIRKLERPTFIRGMEKPTTDEMVVFWSNIIFFILNSNNERPYLQYWLPKPIARPAMVWSGATINANVAAQNKNWLSTVLAKLTRNVFDSGNVMGPPLKHNMPSFTTVAKLFKNVIFKLIKMLYPGGTGCSIKFVDAVGNAGIISEGSGYEIGDLLVVRFTRPDTGDIYETTYEVTGVMMSGVSTLKKLAHDDSKGSDFESYADESIKDESFDTYTITKNRGNFYQESHYDEVFCDEALENMERYEQLHWVDNNPYYPSPTRIMARVCQMLQPYLCQKSVNVPGPTPLNVIYCRRKDTPHSVPYGCIAEKEKGKTDYRHVRYATVTPNSYESQEIAYNTWFNYTNDTGDDMKPWLVKDDMLTMEVFYNMVHDGDLTLVDDDYEWIKEWWGRMQGQTSTDNMFKRGGHLENAGEVFANADFGHIEVQLPSLWGETSEIDTVGGYFFPFYENTILMWKGPDYSDVDLDNQPYRFMIPDKVLLEGIFEGTAEKQKIVKYPIGTDGDRDQRISLNMAELRNILTKTVLTYTVTDVVKGLVDNNLIPIDSPSGSNLENIWEIREAYTIWKVQHYMFLNEFVSDFDAINSGRGAWDAFRSQDITTTRNWHRGKPRKLLFNDYTNGDNYNRDIYEETRIPRIQHYLGVYDNYGALRVTPWSHRGYENTAIALTQVHSSMGKSPSYKFRNMTIGFYEAVQDIENLQNQDQEVYEPYETFANEEKRIRLMQPSVDEKMRNWTDADEQPAKGYLITGNRSHIRIRGVRLDRKKAYSSVQGWWPCRLWYGDASGNGLTGITKVNCQPKVIMQIVSNDMYIGQEDTPEYKKSGLIFHMGDRHSEMLIGGFYPFKNWGYSQQLQRLDVDKYDNLKHNPCINNYTAMAKIIRAKDEWQVDAIEKDLVEIPDENYYNCVPIKNNEQLKRFVLVKTLPTPFFRVIVNTFYNGKGQNAVRDWELIKNLLPPKLPPEVSEDIEGVAIRRTSRRHKSVKETIPRGSLSEIFLELKF